MINAVNMEWLQTKALQEGTPKSIVQKAKSENRNDPSFAQILKNTVYEVNRTGENADRLISNFASGKNTDIHQTMIAIEKADISFQLVTQIRNKLIAAYQEVYRMQV